MGLHSILAIVWSIKKIMYDSHSFLPFLLDLCLLTCPFHLSFSNFKYECPFISRCFNTSSLITCSAYDIISMQISLSIRIYTSSIKILGSIYLTEDDRCNKAVQCWLLVSSRSLLIFHICLVSAMYPML